MKSGGSQLGIKGQLAVIGCITAVAAVALFMVILSFTGFRFSLSDIPYFFLNEQEITIDGKFDCVPNRTLAICQPGFQSNDGKYFLVTNIEEIFEQDADLRQERATNTARQFQIAGTFTYGLEDKQRGFEAVGRIEVASIASIS